MGLINGYDNQQFEMSPNRECINGEWLLGCHCYMLKKLSFYRSM